MTDQTKLQAAISALGAVEVAPGITAYKIPGGGWATVASQVFEREASKGLESMEFSGQEVLAVLPLWWTPERRFAIYDPSGNLTSHLHIPFYALSDGESTLRVMSTKWPIKSSTTTARCCQHEEA